MIESTEDKIKKFLYDKEIDLVGFVDISLLPASQNKRFPVAIIFGKALSRRYLSFLATTPGYVNHLRSENRIAEDEFDRTEKNTDHLADELALFLVKIGYKAYAQSEKNIENTGFYNKEAKSTPLPHKTIAVLGGWGWIGKHNLLVTPEFGSAISMCTVLTDAPVQTANQIPDDPACGECTICKEVCPVHAINGKNWSKGIHRDELVDVYKCTTCLQCMVQCPYTKKYYG